MKDTLAIIGSHPRTRGDFDFTRTDADIWVFNEAVSNHTFPRADAVFQMHDEVIWRNPVNRNDPHHFEWLTTQTETPIYMQDTYTDIPAAKKYPLDEIGSRFGIKYFTSSVSYALALAAHMGYRKVELYGVEMETNTEYAYQRDGVALWVGILRGLGVEVDARITMFDAPLYGYEGEVAIPYGRFDERIAELQPHLNNLENDYRSALSQLKPALHAFADDCSKQNEDALYKAVETLRQAGDKLGMIDGAAQENARYKGRADEMKKASGGEFIFSRQEFESGAAALQNKIEQEKIRFISLGTQLGNTHQQIRQAAKGSRKRDQAVANYVAILQAQMESNNTIAIYRGASQENIQYMAYLDQHIKAAGGEKSERVMLEAMQEHV